MTSDPAILVVDDEPELRSMLEDYLTQHGLTVLTADGGDSARQIVGDHEVALAILDIKMPGEDGLSLARFLRQLTPNAPLGIIMLTAVDDMIDRILALEMGADDYLTKPFDPRELLARIKSVIRRLQPASRGGAPVPERLRLGRCVLDLNRHQLFTLEGDEVPLTHMEFELLRAFVTHPNHVLTRDQLLAMAHDRDCEPFDRSVDIRVTRLRRKIELNPKEPQVIKTIRGAGYMFVPTETVQAGPTLRPWSREDAVANEWR